MAAQLMTAEDASALSLTRAAGTMTAFDVFVLDNPPRATASASTETEYALPAVENEEDGFHTHAWTQTAFELASIATMTTASEGPTPAAGSLDLLLDGGLEEVLAGVDVGCGPDDVLDPSLYLLGPMAHNSPPEDSVYFASDGSVGPGATVSVGIQAGGWGAGMSSNTPSGVAGLLGLHDGERGASDPGRSY